MSKSRHDTGLLKWLGLTSACVIAAPAVVIFGVVFAAYMAVTVAIDAATSGPIKE